MIFKKLIVIALSLGLVLSLVACNNNNENKVTTNNTNNNTIQNQNNDTNFNQNVNQNDDLKEENNSNTNNTEETNKENNSSENSLNNETLAIIEEIKSYGLNNLYIYDREDWNMQNTDFEILSAMRNFLKKIDDKEFLEENRYSINNISPFEAKTENVDVERLAEKFHNKLCGTVSNYERRTNDFTLYLDDTWTYPEIRRYADINNSIIEYLTLNLKNNYYFLGIPEFEKATENIANGTITYKDIDIYPYLATGNMKIYKEGIDLTTENYKEELSQRVQAIFTSNYNNTVEDKFIDLTHCGWYWSFKKINEHLKSQVPDVENYAICVPNEELNIFQNVNTFVNIEPVYFDSITEYINYISENCTKTNYSLSGQLANEDELTKKYLTSDTVVTKNNASILNTTFGVMEAGKFNEINQIKAYDKYFVLLYNGVVLKIEATTVVNDEKINIDSDNQIAYISSLNKACILYLTSKVEDRVGVNRIKNPPVDILDTTKLGN